MNHEISLTAAVVMTTRFRENKSTVLQSAYQQAEILATCETFDKSSVLELLNQSSAAKLRIYYGMDESLKVHAILVAADENGADILPTNNEQNEDDGLILEDAQRCPPYCPPPSELNGG